MTRVTEQLLALANLYLAEARRLRGRADARTVVQLAVIRLAVVQLAKVACGAFADSSSVAGRQKRGFAGLS